jgi:hypothetical protein
VLALFGLFGRSAAALERLRIGLALALVACWAYALGSRPLVGWSPLPRMDVGEVRRVVPTTGCSSRCSPRSARVLLDPRRGARRLALALALAVAVALGASAAYVQHLGAAARSACTASGRALRRGRGRRVQKVSPVAGAVELGARLRREGRHRRRLVRGRRPRALIADRLMDRSAPGIATAVLALACVADLGVYHFGPTPSSRRGFLAPDPLLAPLAAERAAGASTATSPTTASAPTRSSSSSCRRTSAHASGSTTSGATS